MKWVARLPQAKGGLIQSVKCRACSLIENKYKIVGCKWDTLTKHVGCKIIICDAPMLVVKKGEDGCNLETWL